MDELKNVNSDGSFMLEGCLDFVEESGFVIDAIDEDFNELLESIGLAEGCKSESDEPNTEDVPDEEDATVKESTVITEKFDAKGVVDKVVGFLKGIWEKIQDAFKTVVSWIDGKAKDIKKKGIDKIWGKINKADIASDKVIGKLHINMNIGDCEWMAPLQFKSVGQSVPEEFVTQLPTQVVNKATKGGVGKKDIDVKSMRKELKDAFLGQEVEVTGKSLWDAKDKIRKILSGGAIKAVKTEYNGARKAINNLIKEWKAKAKVVKKEDKEAAKEIKNYINYARRCGQLLHTGVCIQFNCIRKQYMEALSIAMKLFVRANKKDEKAAAKEEKKEENTNEAAVVDIFAW